MVHTVDADNRFRNARWIRDIARHQLNVQVTQVVDFGCRADQASNALALFDKGSNKMPTDEPTCTRHEVDRHCSEAV